MSYAHTKRRKNIAKFKRLFPDAWRIVLGLTAARVRGAHHLAETIKSTTGQLPVVLTIQQTAAILGVGKRDVENLMQTGIPKRAAEPSRDRCSFQRDAVLKRIGLSECMQKATPPGIQEFQAGDNPFIPSKLHQ